MHMTHIMPKHFVSFFFPVSAPLFLPTMPEGGSKQRVFVLLPWREKEKKKRKTMVTFLRCEIATHRLAEWVGPPSRTGQSLTQWRTHCVTLPAAGCDIPPGIIVCGPHLQGRSPRLPLSGAPNRPQEDASSPHQVRGSGIARCHGYPVGVGPVLVCAGVWHVAPASFLPPFRFCLRGE